MLPAFIEATGISDMRSAYAEKEEGKKLKQKQRDKMTVRTHAIDSIPALSLFALELLVVNTLPCHFLFVFAGLNRFCSEPCPFAIGKLDAPHS